MKNLVRTLIICSAFFATLTNFAYADEAAAPKKLTLQQCVDTAVKTYAGITVAQESLKQSESKIGQARAGYMPQLTANANYSRYGFPGLANTSAAYDSDRAYNSFETDLTLSQTLFDFGRVSLKTKVAALTADASRMSLQDTISKAVYNVKQAYFNLLLAQRKEAVARDVVAQFERHLEQASRFFEVGLKPRFDVTKAESDLSSSKVDLIRAENSRINAALSLNFAMGVEDTTVYELDDTLVYDNTIPKLEDSLALAYSRRPDLKSLELQLEAAEKSLTQTRLDYLPTIAGSAQYKLYDDSRPLKNKEWLIGLNASFNITNGGLTYYQVKQAEAARNAASASVRLTRQQVYLDVEQAWIGVSQASRSIPASELALKKAKENLDIANGRYDAGVGDPIEVTDAQISYKDAQLSMLQTLTDYKTSQAALEHATGGI